MIDYSPVYETMKKKKISTYYLINKCGMSSSIFYRLKRNLNVSCSSINDLCKYMECDILDIMKYIPDTECAPDGSGNYMLEIDDKESKEFVEKDEMLDSVLHNYTQKMQKLNEEYQKLIFDIVSDLK